jgi:hypothetical protein
MQNSVAGQLCICALHSSMLMQLFPDPEYPERQAQRNEPAEFKQLATWALHVSSPNVHSFTSVHALPFPV